MATPTIRYLQTKELGSPDVLNRPIRDLITAFGLNPDAVPTTIPTGLAVYNSIIARDLAVPAPTIDRLVYRSDTKALERWTGLLWSPEVKTGISIDVVAGSAARDILYPAPAIDQRVYRTDTGDLERWNSVTWVIDAERPSEMFNVKKYGAKGDGVTDDSLAFQLATTAAINTATKQGAIVYIPPGKYLISESIVAFNVKGLMFVGAGNGRTNIYWNRTGAYGGNTNHVKSIDMLPGFTRPIPTNVVAVTSGVGGTLSAGQYRYRITAINDYGDSMPSPEAIIVASGTTSSNTITWDHDTNVRGYVIWVTPVGFGANGSNSFSRNIIAAYFTGITTDIFSSTTIGKTLNNFAINAYAGTDIRITSGTGIGQVRRVASNTATTFTMTTPWATIPDATSLWDIILADSNKFVHTGQTLIDGARDVFSLVNCREVVMRDFYITFGAKAGCGVAMGKSSNAAGGQISSHCQFSNISMEGNTGNMKFGFGLFPHNVNSEVIWNPPNIIYYDANNEHHTFNDCQVVNYSGAAWLIGHSQSKRNRIYNCNWDGSFGHYGILNIAGSFHAHGCGGGACHSTVTNNDMASLFGSDSSDYAILDRNDLVSITEHDSEGSRRLLFMPGYSGTVIPIYIGYGRWASSPGFCEPNGRFIFIQSCGPLGLYNNYFQDANVAQTLVVYNNSASSFSFESHGNSWGAFDSYRTFPYVFPSWGTSPGQRINISGDQFFVEDGDTGLGPNQLSGPALLYANSVVQSAIATVITVAGTPYVAAAYNNMSVKVTAGTGIGQFRTISANTNNTVTVTRAFSPVLDNTSKFDIIGSVSLYGPAIDGVFPSIWVNKVWETGNTVKTAIRGFNGGYEGCEIRINVSDNFTTFVHDAYNYRTPSYGGFGPGCLLLPGGVDLSPPIDSQITFKYDAKVNMWRVTSYLPAVATTIIINDAHALAIALGGTARHWIYDYRYGTTIATGVSAWAEAANSPTAPILAQGTGTAQPALGANGITFVRANSQYLSATGIKVPTPGPVDGGNAKWCIAVVQDDLGAFPDFHTLFDFSDAASAVFNLGKTATETYRYSYSQPLGGGNIVQSANDGTLFRFHYVTRERQTVNTNYRARFGTLAEQTSAVTGDITNEPTALYVGGSRALADYSTATLKLLIFGFDFLSAAKLALINDYIVLYHSPLGVLPAGANAYAGNFRPTGGIPHISGDRGDNSITVYAGGDSPVQRFNTTLAASRTVTLSTVGAIKGDQFTVVRQAGAGGVSSNLSVVGITTKVLINAGLTCTFEFDGAGWQHIGSTTL